MQQRRALHADVANLGAQAREERGHRRAAREWFGEARVQRHCAQHAHSERGGRLGRRRRQEGRERAGHVRVEQPARCHLAGSARLGEQRHRFGHFPPRRAALTRELCNQHGRARGPAVRIGQRRLCLPHGGGIDALVGARACAVGAVELRRDEVHQLLLATRQPIWRQAEQPFTGVAHVPRGDLSTALLRLA